MYEIPKIIKIILKLCICIFILFGVSHTLGKNDFIIQNNEPIKKESDTEVIIHIEDNTVCHVELGREEELESDVTEIEKETIEENYIDYDTPTNDAFKSYMDYRTITDETSKQYELQKQAYTEWHGIRMVDDRYCIAVGSYYSTTIGENIDVILENGNVIKCIVAELKKDKHTDITNRQNPNGSVIEFIVDTDILHKKIQKTGDISTFDRIWNVDLFNGEISYLRIYK